MNHPLIESIKNSLLNPPDLYKILISLCKKQNINATFNLYKTNTINLIIKYQNNIRHLIGWYLCKYTYIPMFPRYMIYDNVEDQIKECGIKANSHQYICCYSGDKLDKEDFDDFMGVGDNIHRTTIDIFDTENITTNNSDSNKNNSNLTHITRIQNLIQQNDINAIISDFDIQQHICFYILYNIFKFKDAEFIMNCISNCKILYKQLLFDDVLNEYNDYLILLNQEFSNLNNNNKVIGKLDKITERDDYLKDIK